MVVHQTITGLFFAVNDDVLAMTDDAIHADDGVAARRTAVAASRAIGPAICLGACLD